MREKLTDEFFEFVAALPKYELYKALLDLPDIYSDKTFGEDEDPEALFQKVIEEMAQEQKITRGFVSAA